MLLLLNIDKLRKKTKNRLANLFYTRNQKHILLVSVNHLGKKLDLHNNN